jgi:hypothetical protein
MPDSPTPETLDWLRQCAAAPGARWHRALLAQVEGQAPPEIEPIPPEGLAWLHQSARVHGATYSQVLLHVLERIELLDQDAIEQSQSNRFSFEAVIKRLELLEAAQQHDTLLIGGPQDKLDRLIELDSDDDAPTPEVAPEARPEGDWFAVAVVAQDMRSRGLAEQIAGDELLKLANCQPPAAQPAPVAAPAGGLVERVALAIGGEGDHPANWTPEARAAIRAVAAWMRDHEHAFNAAYWLELEVGCA